MKNNADTAIKLTKARAKVRKLRHDLLLMTSARESIQAQLARERRTWECQRQEGLEVNQRQAAAIDALRAELARERYDVAMANRRLRAGAAGVTGLLADLDSLDSLHDIRQRIDAIGIAVHQPQPTDLPAAAAAGKALHPEPSRTYPDDVADPEPNVFDASSSDRLRWHARQAMKAEMLDLLEAAWGIIANAGPIEQDPPTATPGWSTAALRFREGYHDLLRRLHPSPMVEPTKTEEELEDELLDARAAQAMAEYQERTGLTAEEVAAKTARGLLDAIDSPLADSTAEEVAALAALADTLAPLRQYEPLSDPAGIVTQDRETGQVVDDTSAACEARIAPTGETTAQPATGFAYTPSEAAKAALAEGSTTDAQAAQAGQEAALEAGERRCHNPEPHWGHDWWDDHEPDATKWFCEGIPAPEVDAEPRPGETLDDLLERHSAYSCVATPTPSIGSQDMEDAIQAGTFTVTDEDGSTATYLHDAVVGRDDPIYTTPPPIELEPERYEALLTYLREEMDAEEPMADATDILRALGLWVRPGPDPEPTDLERLAAIAPPTGAIDRLVADVLAHVQGGPNSPGGWFLDAADALYPGLGTFRSGQRDHIWTLATELARERIAADLVATELLLIREREVQAVATERAERFSEAHRGYAEMLAQLGEPTE